MTRPLLLALLGDPVERSLSPRLHALFAAQAGLPLEFRLVRAEAASLPSALLALREAGAAGSSVTAPLKQAAFSLADRSSPRARACGSCNCLSFLPDGSLLADSTDGPGLLSDLARLRIPVSGRRVLLLGAGGAARSILPALLSLSPASLTLANRSPERALALRSLFGACVSVSPLSSLQGPFDLAINATSSGLRGDPLPLPDGLLAPGSACYELSYGRETPFLAWARRNGAASLADGLGMLAFQAAESFSLWTGFSPDAELALRSLSPSPEA